MSTTVKITSTPDADGNHKLKCPQCQTVFFSPVTKNDDTGAIDDITCASCSHREAALAFLHEANRKEANKIVMDYAENELKKIFKKSLRNSKHVKFK
ncbi:hypothetical protein GX865_03860 [Candidatus Saccharibacteria bacterium]|jgi:DNA-directed RNA polymerase subunit RPC12/RpoP|nr:hypothetical protein [Candidatus Saccharibacteria bacterium]